MVERYKKMTAMELRQAYGEIMMRSEAESKEVFNAKVCAMLPNNGQDSTPLTFVLMARRASFPCKRCAGTGKFITMVENGKPKGPGGDCFRCRGKGVQNDKDVCRNAYYDAHFFGQGATA